jgi:hypothetical protein
MQVATLGQLRTVFTKETLFDGKYCISKAVRGSTLLLESLGFGETDDPCMLRLTLAEPSDCQPADREAAWHALQALPGDLALLITLNNGTKYVVSISVELQGLHLRLYEDSTGKNSGVTSTLLQCNALWRFGPEYWDKELHGMPNDSIAVDAQAVAALAKIRTALGAPHYAPRLAFVWCDGWRCLAPKQLKTHFDKLGADHAKKQALVHQVDQGRLSIYRWDGKTLAALFSSAPERILELY